MSQNTLPTKLLSRLKEIYSPSDFEAILAAFNLGDKRMSAFRINTLKATAEEVEKELKERGVHFKSFVWILGAYTLPKSDEYNLKGSRAFYDGKIYVQSLASQIPARCFSDLRWKKILDVCAAPGGKTTELAMISGNSWEIIALEQSPIRADKLSHNIKLQGVSSACVLRMPAENYLVKEDVPLFDAILLDAPCSSEGRIRLEEERTYSFWSEELVAKRANIAWKLLTLAWSKLQSGWELIYSTCTLAPEENEAIISRALFEFPDAEIETIPLELSFMREGIAKFKNTQFDPRVIHTRRIVPCAETEGFFVAKLRKQ